jgi:hypothetical protein
MANVFVEARPKGKPAGSPITDYIVEDRADSRSRVIPNPRGGNALGQDSRPYAARRASPTPQRQGQAGPLAEGLARRREAHRQRRAALSD